MPVEIKELIIRTHVTAGNAPGKSQNSVALTPQDKRRIIDTCIREVLQQVQKSDER